MPTMLTPAQGAAIFGDVKSLTNYIKNGDKSVFMPDKGGLTSVHSAAQGGHLECLRLLIENGAEVNSVSKKGETPADLAAQGGHIECFRFLRENGGGESGLVLVGKNANLKHSNNDAKFKMLESITPVIISAFHGDSACLRLLIEKYRDVNKVDSEGISPIYAAAYSDRLDCLRLLIEMGGDVNKSDDDGRTPLHVAASKGHFKCLRLLLEKVDDVDVSTKDGATALHFAAADGKANCIRLLLDQGADINGNSKSAHGTPLQCAKINNHTGCVELLLRNGANDVVEDSDNVQKAGIGEVIMNTVAKKSSEVAVQTVTQACCVIS